MPNSIVIAPYPKSRPDGKANAKQYPHWAELCAMLAKAEIDIIQVVAPGEATVHASVMPMSFDGMRDIERLVSRVGAFASVDNYMQHLAHYIGVRGVVLYGPSDPSLFGYKENVNLYAGDCKFRPNQFATWSECEFDESSFVTAQDAFDAIVKLMKNGF